MDSSENIQIVPLSKYEAVLSQLEKQLPKSARTFNQLKAYCRYGKLKHTHTSVFIAKNDQYESFVMVVNNIDQVKIVYVIAYWDPEQIPTKILGKMILEVPNVKENGFLFLGLSNNMDQQFREAVKELGNDFPLTYPPFEECHVDLMTLDSPPENIPSIPPEYVIEELRPEDFPLVTSYWLYPFLETHENMINRMEVFGAYGAYEISKDGSHKELVAWTQRYSDSTIGMTRTLEAHRRKGLGRALTLTCVKRVLEDGENPVTGVIQGEEISRKFHESFGFKFWNTYAYGFYLPKNVSVTDL